VALELSSVCGGWTAVCVIFEQGRKRLAFVDNPTCSTAELLAELLAGL
jgi:hypothetical protein